ncbi:MAG TPA: hypothetical protein VMI52_02415, partial [Acetobacteraceae bacterium]|nr:hypothetical protein [Acetobacteraceae bacterium]
SPDSVQPTASVEQPCDLRAAGERESRLRDKIAKLSGESRHFTLQSNQSEPLGEGHSVGVGDGNPTSLEVIQDNKDYEMKAGNSIQVDLTDKRCILTLTSLNWPNPVSGDFDWSCKAK